jgi:hypothetical protein
LISHTRSTAVFSAPKLFRRGLSWLVKSGLCLSLVSCGGYCNWFSSCESTAVPDAGVVVGPVIPLVATLSLIAGDIGGSGSVDAIGTNARFSGSEALTVDSIGNVYVADTANHAIRKITPAGVVTTLAGRAGSSGYADGAGAAARFYLPNGIAVDTAGNVYVGDSGNNVVRQITAAGVVTTLAGSGVGTLADGTGTAASFSQPAGLVVDAMGNVFVADTVNHAIRKITPAGVVTTLAGGAGFGHVDATGAAARFHYPTGMAADSAGNLYVTDFGSHTIRKITLAGVVTTLAGTTNTPGSADGTGSAAQFSNAIGLAVDAADNLFVGDGGNHAIRMITPAGVVTTPLGSAGNSGSADGTGSAARLNNPRGVAFDASGILYIADTNNNTIRKSTAAGVVTTWAGAVAITGSADNTGAAARFNSPTGIAADAAGNLYVADTNNNTIRKITPAGVVTTLAGAAGVLGGADGNGSAARFMIPQGISADAMGNLHVSATAGHTIRHVTAAGAVTTLAGSHLAAGNTDATGTSARFFNPRGVVADGAGNLYVADTANTSIRKVTPGGLVSTLAGSGTAGSTDGTGTAARFNSPWGIAIDGAGNLYVTEANLHTIRKIVIATGVVSTLAGTAGSNGTADGTGAAARFNGPYGIAADAGGTVYVADSNNHTIRQITPGGDVTTITGVAGVRGILPGTGLNGLSRPFGLALIGPGTLAVISESGVLKIVLD